MKINILFVGDVVGRPGRRILSQKLPVLVRQRDIDCVIVNAENAAGGSGLTEQIYDKLLKYGTHLITLGDHTYRKKGIIPLLQSADNIVRPANLSPAAAGKDFAVYQTAKGITVGVAILIGRIFMKPSDCLFAKIDSLLPRIKAEADIVVIDMHAEATSEKVAMGRYLDGKVSCVIGTHTHIATADEKILPKGTAYITDIGMTGAYDSVLGRKTENVIKAFRTQMPFPFEIATGDVRTSAAVITVNATTGCAESIERIELAESDGDEISYDSDDGKPDYYNEF